MRVRGGKSEERSERLGRKRGGRGKKLLRRVVKYEKREEQKGSIRKKKANVKKKISTEKEKRANGKLKMIKTNGDPKQEIYRGNQWAQPAKSRMVKCWRDTKR